MTFPSPPPSPAVSVIIPCYNGARYLPATLDSILAQTLSDWEAIIIDDGSTDETPEVIAAYERRDPRIRSLRKANGGLPAARNSGILVSRAPVLAFMDADDLWMPQFLEVMMARLDAEPDVGGVACAHLTFTDPEHPETLRPLPGDGPRLRIDDILRANGWSPHAALVRREICDQAGPFDESLTSVEDWDFWLRVLALTEFAAHREPLALYRHHPGQMSRNPLRMARNTLRVTAGFRQRHPEIIHRYGSARFRRNVGSLLLVQATKARETGQHAVAARLTLQALLRAPCHLLKRAVLLWLPSPLTRFVVRLKGKTAG